MFQIYPGHHLFISHFNIAESQASWTNPSERHKLYANIGFKVLLEIPAKLLVADLCLSDLDAHCIADSFKMIDALDCRGERASCFSTELITLMNSPGVGTYLKDLTSVLKLARSDFNLWSWTLSHPSVGENPQAALKILGVLFQDAPNSLLNPALSLPNSLNASLFRRAILALWNSEIQRYPPGLEHIKEKQIYHFYTVAYLSMKIRMRGASEQNSKRLPCLLNTYYEAVASDKNLDEIYLGFQASYLTQIMFRTRKIHRPELTDQANFLQRIQTGYKNVCIDFKE